MLPATGLAGRYLESLRSANYAQTTIYDRGRTIIRFRLATGFDPLEADEHQMIGWFVGLSLQPHAKAVTLSSIRHYCRWAVRHGHLAADPTRLLDRPRVARRYPRPIAEVDLGSALTSARRDTRAILTLAAFCGLRACEISVLNWGDIHGDVILIHGKGAKERILPLHPLARDSMLALPGKHRGSVIERRDGNPGIVKPWTISEMANKYLHSLGIPETLHQLRHRFATQLYQSSRDIRLCQDLLGHASPDTTAAYAAWDKTEAAGAVARLPIPA